MLTHFQNFSPTDSAEIVQ